MNTHLKTHTQTDFNLCGKPIQVETGYSLVELITTQTMAVDEKGLVHGGFVFGLADFAAMIAVNHPNVVLGSAQVTFLKPVKVGDTVIARARVEQVSGKKQLVKVTAECNDTVVFEGDFTCFTLDKHVLD